MGFDIEITLPSGKVRRVNELNNRDYITICKYAENGDYKGLNTLFEELYLDSDLNLFDRFYLMLYVRMVFVDSKITLKRADDQKVDVGLAALLNNLEENYQDFETTFTEGNYTITLDLPNISYFNTVDVMLTSCIKVIDNGVSTLNFFELNEEDQTLILENLPIAIYNRLKSFIDMVSERMCSVTLVAANESIGLEEFNISLVGNGVMAFLTSIFGTSLQHMYELIYVFTNTVTPGADVFFNISPIESKIIMRHHNQRIKEQNDQLKKQKER